MLTGMRRNKNSRKRPTSLGLGLSFYSFSDHFTAVIDLLLGLLPVQIFLRIKQASQG